MRAEKVASAGHFLPEERPELVIEHARGCLTSAQKVVREWAFSFFKDVAPNGRRLLVRAAGEKPPTVLALASTGALAIHVAFFAPQPRVDASETLAHCR